MNNNFKELLVPGATPLWRYVRLNTLLLYLQGRCFWPSIKKLQDCDAKEGNPICQTEWILAQFSDSERQQIEKWALENRCTSEEKQNIKANRGYLNYSAEIVLRHYFDFVNKTRFTWCWYQSNYESAAMWQLYGRDGVAVKSSAVRLRAALEAQPGEFLISRVAYFDRAERPLDYFNPEKPGNKELILRPYFVKGVEYNHENEVRIVTARGSRNGCNGILLSGLAPETWIEEIAIWPGLPRGEEPSVKETINNLCPKLNVTTRRSDLYERDPQKSESEAAINGQADEVFDSHWINGSDGIPQFLRKL